MDLCPYPGGETRESFINQAHEARQNRELGRRRDSAATKIQSFLKTCLIRQKLKTEAIQELNDIIKLGAFPNDTTLLPLLRRLLFICDPIKDRTTIDILLESIIELPTSKDTTNNKDASNQSDVSDTTIIEYNEDMTLNDKADTDNAVEIRPSQYNFVQLTVSRLKANPQALNIWIETIAKLLKHCINYLRDANSSRLDSQHIDLYLKVIKLFITDEISTQAKYNDQDIIDSDKDLIKEISGRLFQRIELWTLEFFVCTTELISGKAYRFRNDLKSSILESYTKLALHILELNLVGGNSAFVSMGISRMLSIPGYISSLNRFSPSSMQLLLDKSFFQMVLDSLNSDHQTLKRLTSTITVFILANLIQLASMSMANLNRETLPFVRLVMKLFECCQKNMISLHHTATSQKKKHSSTAAYYNLILGWISKETAPYHDDQIIKSQLSHLWSLSMLKSLLADLMTHNQLPHSIEQDALSKAQSQSHTGTKITKDDSNEEPICDTSVSTSNQSPVTSQISLFKRAVERAANAMSRTINSTTTKNLGISRNSGLTKLMSPQTTRIANVCCMLYTSLKTLKALKQDILTGLCLHDYLLTSLWTFMKNLDSHNGLKTFLEHLTVYTKTSAPEFFILTLFCECASHLISILDDSELYEKQQPFKIDDLVTISTFLNNFVYRIICNNLIPIDEAQEIDPVLQTAHKLLTDLYKRDCRRRFAPQDHWLIKDIKISLFMKDLESGKPIAKAILKLLPHAIPHKVRVVIFRRLVARDKQRNFSPEPCTYITIHRSRIVEDGYQQLIRLPANALKGLIRVRFINDYGLDEAGLDQDGVFKEFLEDTIKKVFDPALNLFRSTSEQCLYPSPTSHLHDDHLSLFKFVGKMLGKAVYEGIVVDVPFASFFLSRVLCQPQSPLYSPIDELPSLDPELYKSLTYIKHYEGDVGELDLTFSIDQDIMGKIETFELEPGGRAKPVTRENRVRYIHAVANFHMKTQIEKQTEAFVSGFRSIINLDWLSMFSASEFQRLISGDNSPIDLQDLRRNTRYFGGFHSSHRVICWLWDILEKDFTPEEHSLFLKFVTSCSKPPLLGFANLEPSFTIRCVEVSDDQDHGDTVGSVLRGFFAIRRSDPVDRLPTSATCFNVLKLPNYQRRSTLRDKLRYAISSNPGFELS